MIASENSDSFFKAYFQSDEQRHSLDWVVPAINVISHEKVIGIGRFASNFE